MAKAVPQFRFVDRKAFVTLGIIMMAMLEPIRAVTSCGHEKVAAIASI